VQAVQDMATLVLSERDAAAQIQRELCLDPSEFFAHTDQAAPAMASVTDISAVMRGESHVGLFSLVAAVKKSPLGKRVWEIAVKRNGTRAKKLQLPVTDEGRVTGNHRDTKIVSASQIPIAARFVFTIDEAIAFFGDQTLVEALSELVRSCGGQEVEVQAVQDMATLVLSERDAAAQIQRELCPGATKLRITVQGDVVYGSILDYLNFQLKLDGHHVWNNWLKADFEKWANAAIIYHKPEGESHATSMTTYQGFCYITRRCVGRSAVSDALADNALLCFSRYKVGDNSMHRELEENSRTAAPVEKAFVLGLEKAAAQRSPQDGEPPFSIPIIPRRQTCRQIPEPVLDWTVELGAAHTEVPTARALLLALFELEIAADALPSTTKTQLKLWTSKPPTRFRALAMRALMCTRVAMEKLHGQAAPTRKRKRVDVELQKSSASIEDDVLRVSEVMKMAKVWKGVWRAFRSDLGNCMSKVKCQETKGAFHHRRLQMIPGGKLVRVHHYKKNSQDWAVAWRSMRETKDLYEKRVREELESLFKCCQSDVLPDTWMKIASQAAHASAAALFMGPRD
jgi:hypothetical protein